MVDSKYNELIKNNKLNTKILIDSEFNKYVKTIGNLNDSYKVTIQKIYFENNNEYINVLKKVDGFIGIKESTLLKAYSENKKIYIDRQRVFNKADEILNKWECMFV